MNTRRAKILGLAAVALVLIGAAAFLWFSRLEFFAWAPPQPGTIVAERVAPDSAVVARVRAGATKGQYVFELRSTHGDELIASEIISAPVGYHGHLITLRWAAASARAIATIDHDFGVGNLEFALAP